MMINLAGNPECDETIRRELEMAHIPVLRRPGPPRGEVPATLVGERAGWWFTRAWYYWVASALEGVLLPFAAADALYEQYGQVVRVAGHCGCPAPQEWYKRPWHRGVPLYHIDTQEGLNAFALVISSVTTPPPAADTLG